MSKSILFKSYPEYALCQGQQLCWLGLTRQTRNGPFIMGEALQEGPFSANTINSVLYFYILNK